MHMHNALCFRQHTCTKKLMSLSGYCVPVKCCMFLVSRITWYQQVVQATFVLKHYTSSKKKYLVQGDIHKCKRMSNIVIPIHNHSKDTKKTKYNLLSLHHDPVSYALGM